jgi:hypothetical protein
MALGQSEIQIFKTFMRPKKSINCFINLIEIEETPSYSGSLYAVIVANATQKDMGGLRG